MDLPHDHEKLTALFENARTPRPSEFGGEYYVDMLTRTPSLRGFAHRKVFRTDGSQVVGENILFNKKTWGQFRLEEGVFEDLGVVVINYGVPANSFLSRRIRDQVRCLEEGRLYLGRFNFLIQGSLRFAGYFSLTKVQPGAGPDA